MNDKVFPHTPFQIYITLLLYILSLYSTVYGNHYFLIFQTQIVQLQIKNVKSTISYIFSNNYLHYSNILIYLCQQILNNLFMSLKVATQKKIDEQKTKATSAIDEVRQEFYYVLRQATDGLSTQLHQSKAILAKVVEKTFNPSYIKEENFKLEDFHSLIPVFGFLFYNTKTEEFIKITPINDKWEIVKSEDESTLTFIYKGIAPSEAYPVQFSSQFKNYEEALMELRQMLFKHYESTTTIQTTV
jgi:hypothetical protein